MTEKMYNSFCNKLYYEIINLYKIKCWRCVHARIVRLARYDTEYYHTPYKKNLAKRKAQYAPFIHKDIAGE